jgi:hypothetical protein
MHRVRSSSWYGKFVTSEDGDSPRHLGFARACTNGSHALLGYRPVNESPRTTQEGPEGVRPQPYSSRNHRADGARAVDSKRLCTQWSLIDNDRLRDIVGLLLDLLR